MSVCSNKNDHHASREWLAERISAVIAIPLLIWLIVSLVSFSCGCYGNLSEFLAKPLNVTLLILFIGNFLFYGTLAMKVVFEDYIQNTCIRCLLTKFMYIAALAAFVFAVISILKIHG